MKNKILITGTGRSGTSFLMRLFTHLGMDTGFTKKQSDMFVDNKQNAGLENLNLHTDNRIHKAPHFAEMIDDINEKFKIDHVIVPMRDLYKSAKSRESVGGLNSAGGLWKANNLEEQIIHNSKLFYNLIYDLTKNNIKYSILHFPNIVYDYNEIYKPLSWLFDEYGITEEVFKVKHDKIKDLKKIRI
tara:strand:- start:2484 stop:3044 length:561 start_codon:yes stop_codon:yes gene_type:complete